IAVLVSRQRFRKQMRVLETERKIHIERERISRDLHDNIGAQITYMVSTLDFLSFRIDKQTVTDNRKLITELGDNARHTMDQLRETIWAMNQPQLSVGEFAEKLRGFLRKTGSGITAQLDIDDREADETVMLAPARVLHLYRIAQEAVNNAVKHAEAKNITVVLKTNAAAFTLLVTDDGKGMPEKSAKDGHYGLDNMQARAKELGATITIKSEPGAGTSITIVSPNKTTGDYDK
ncbi:MAG: sensor histidine kinase, partial [Bacteroidia bacterium]